MLIIGIDEVGRGPIAGPVAVCAFVFLNSKAKKIFRGVKESKQLTEAKREDWFMIIEKAIKDGDVDFRITFQSERVIDTKGLSYAIKHCLSKSLNGLNINPANAKILLDGGLHAPAEYINQKTIVKGDEKEMAIALASICAKVNRDRYMRKIARKYSDYGFEDHKGYGTARHYKAIKKYGVVPIHRMSFLKKILPKLGF